MKYLKILATATVAITIGLQACTKDEYTPNPSKEKEIPIDKYSKKSYAVQQNEELIVLGNKLEDPYALNNMKRAYSNLKATNPSLPDVDIQPTHMYMRFLPNTEEEWGLLKSDTTLVFYDFPLNFEISNLGTYYHDPSLPQTAITWQYCVIPIKHTIPNVQHELLYEVYIPDDDITYSTGSPEVSQLLVDLEYESVKITGNLPQIGIDSSSTKGIFSSKWSPKGTIKVWDDVIGSTTTYTQVFDH